MNRVELIEKRKPREKHYLQKDGTICAEIYGENIHYLKDGKYVEIDDTLIKKNKSFVNKSNEYKVEFPDDLNESLVKITKDDNYIDFKISDLKQKNNGIIRNLSDDCKGIIATINEDISVKYQLLSNKVKETIVLNNSNHDNLCFELNTNLKLREENGSIIVFDDKNNVVFTIEKPYMVDSNDIRNNNIYYSIEQEKSMFRLNLITDRDWLLQEGRKFPVFIDPTITIDSNNNSSFEDTFIYPGDDNDNNYTLDYLIAGTSRNNNVDLINRTLIRFPLPEIGTSDEIVDAYLSLLPYVGENIGDAYDNFVEVHRITQDWHENTAKWNNMHNKYDSRVEELMPTYRSTIDLYSIVGSPIYFNITGLVKKWYQDTPNYGVMLKAADENYLNNSFPMFFSSDTSVTGNPKPIFVLQYRNRNGIEGYWDYKKQVYSSGVSYINTHTGNLTTLFRLGHTIGGVFPATLDLIYNTNDVVLNNQTFFGKGYKLSLEQEIKVHTDQLEFNDEDGTIHFFTKQDSNTNVYYDEDGLKLTIELVDNKYVMTDVYNTKKEFENINNHYLLKKIIDVDNNTINIVYNTNNSIQKIVDSYNNEISLTYNTSSIIVNSPDNTTMELNFNNTNQLVSLESIDGFIYFVYDNNGIISSIEDVTGIKTTFQYYNSEPYMVKKLIEYGLNNTLGRTYEFDYSIYETSIVNNKGIIENIAYDNNGNVCSRCILSDEDDIDNAYTIEKEYNEKNHLTSSMITNKYVKNYLSNSSFESNDLVFTADLGIAQSFDSSYYNSGTRCLKLISSGLDKSITKNIIVPKGDYYTFSGYFLGNVSAEISLSYIDSNNHEVVSKQSIDMNNSTFTRNDVTILYDGDALSDLKISIIVNEIGTIYVDDVQLEKNPVVNYYNFIDNSDFDNGLTGWNCIATKNNISVVPSDYISVVGVCNNKNALHINMEPKLLTQVDKVFNIKGNEGDAYTISFWYKNNATTQYTQYVGSNVIIFYEPYDDENGHCILSQNLPITNGDSWQHFVYTEQAIEDYKSIKIIFQNYGSANSFEVTNISFYKDVPKKRYLYNSNDILDTITNQNDEEKSIEYDNNDQVIKVTDTIGNSISYEYDNSKKNRLINTISGSGLSDFKYYDNRGNLIKLKKSKRYLNTITSGQYKLRLQGTDKYVKAEMNLVLLEKNDCSNTIWFLEQNNNKYKIKNAFNLSYSVSYNDGIITLCDNDTNNLFSLYKNDDGSYNFVYEKPINDGIELMVLYATNNGELALKPYSSVDKSGINYYVELAESLFMENDKEYTSDGKYLSNEIDSSMYKDEYEYYNQTGLLKKITNSNGIVTEYSYNNKKQCSRIKYDNIYVDYTYNNKLLSNISSGNKNYSFIYDNFGNLSSVNLNNNNLSSLEYYSNNGKIKKITYGNNQYVSSDYDDFDRISEIIKSDNTYNYYYDTNSNLSKIKSLYDTRRIYYDSNNRPYKYSSSDFIVDYSYNSEGCILQKRLRYKNDNHLQTNTFDNEKLVSTNLDNVQITYTYDALNRNIGKNVGNLLSTSLSFDKLGNRTSNILGKYIVNNNEYSIIYDDSLNIKQLYLNNVLKREYEYDNYNELICEKDYDSNIEIDYTYNSAGNVLSKVIKNMNNNSIISTDTFTYSNSNWEDQLSSYNNNSITYDSIGNMLTYKNDVYTWKNGNELSTFTNSNNNLSISYEYDDRGIRTSKTVNNIITKFINLNDDIIYEDRNGTVIYYLYDSDGIIGFNYNNSNYYYIKNPNNDIIGLLDENGIIVVSYSYDSWGKLLSIKDSNNTDVTNNMNHIGNINPFRYKSYYYDVETGLYYLGHRYYNPELIRFISPDSIIGANKDILSYNLYSYVSNNPISNYDRTGQRILSWLISLTINTAISKVIDQTKKLLKSSMNNGGHVSGMVKEKKTKTPPLYNLTFGFGSNIKIDSTIGNNSISYNSASGYTSDYNYGGFGYEVGSTSGDIYGAINNSSSTTKFQFGIDGNYVFTGIDENIDIDNNESFCCYVKYGVRREVVIVGAAVGYAFLAAAAFESIASSITIPTLGSVLEKAVAIYSFIINSGLPAFNG